MRPPRKNISFLCSYYTSSVSKWEQYKSGSPLDHSRDSARFSFHTDKETNPFIHIDLPGRVAIEAVSLRPRDQYTTRVLPFEVFVRKGSGRWRSLGKIEEMSDYAEFPANQRIDAIRVVKHGYGFLYFSAIDIWAGQAAFESMIAKFDNHRNGMTVVYAPWYGLGGGLATCASAAGAVEKTGNSKFVSVVPFQDLIDYPVAFSRSQKDVAFIRETTSTAFASELLGEAPKPPSEINIAMLTEDGKAAGQNRPCVIVSRDHPNTYSARKESNWRTLQRLYGRLSPSSKVLARLLEIKDRAGLDEQTLSAALGVHIRHGNGERYYSTRHKTWGVKPPSRANIVRAIASALDGSEVTTLVVCSDTSAVRDLLRSEFPDLNIVFVSDAIQEIGAGCNHLESAFDATINRKAVERKDDDVQSFAEILVLSECSRLCGGSSYFFNAAVGFSSIAPEMVFFLDNSDRYATISSNARPLLETELPEGEQLAAALRAKGQYIDGLFLQQHSEQSTFGLSYFNDELRVGTIDALLTYTASPDFTNDISALRLY